MYNKDGDSGVQLTGLRPEGAAPAAWPGGATPSHYGAAPVDAPEQDPGRPATPPVLPPVEDRTALRVAAQLPPPRDAL
jgi:hypothetical protein